jgi:hypothetical protein
MRFFVATMLISYTSVLSAAEPGKMLELQIGKTTVTGAIAAKDEETFWLLQRDGRLDSFPIQDVTDYKPLGGAFRPLSSTDLRDQLIKEFGRGYVVGSSTHYLVVAGKGQSKRFVALFEDLYRHLHVYLAARNFRIHEPEFPLVAVVFPNQQTFVEYCLSEKVRPSPGLRGYYLHTSNRVALFDTGDTTGSLDGTVIHEAVHQVAFNLGLHRRIGENPLWVAEGLATAFEPETFRSPLPTTPISAKINRERYLYFRNYLSRRPAKSLEEFVKSDGMFQSATLDAYSQAWALTFFLLETRQQQYSQYLKRIAARPQLEPYTEEDRLADFQEAFGKNLDSLDADFVRFVSGLGK